MKTVFVCPHLLVTLKKNLKQERIFSLRPQMIHQFFSFDDIHFCLPNTSVSEKSPVPVCTKTDKERTGARIKNMIFLIDNFFRKVFLQPSL